VDFTGKRVAVIGTGSSGIQSIPLIAAQASQLTVFQRTANYSIPANNGPVDPGRQALLAEDRQSYRHAGKWSRGGVPMKVADTSILAMSEQERRERFERAWAKGELMAFGEEYSDTGVNAEANELLCEMIREKIREKVQDPETAEALCPKDHYFGTKRPCLDTRYFETFNQPHVRLVDLRKHPIASITESGIDTVDESFEFDAIVYATGFDAMTGALVSVDITGRDGVTLKDKWAHGPSTYLGLTSVGFPNLFMITGPGSPSVLSNMAVSIEQHVDWVSDTLVDLRQRGFETIEPTQEAEDGWNAHVNDCANITLFPIANSWYMGANVPGKPRVFLPYVGGVDAYRAVCDEVREQDYLGFRLAGPEGEQCRNGIVRRLQPDVKAVLDKMATLDVPAIESLSPEEARAFVDAGAALRPPGPDVAEIVDGVLPGAAGDLNYRLYRPEGEGPHPLVVYFHGGGWVLGSSDSDDPFCRDMCVRTGAVFVSVDYRHAPEARFPAAAEDAFAALRWIAANTIELGGIPGSLAVAGWSAGGNLAAVVCQLAKEAGGPDIVAQLLLTPVTDSNLDTGSYQENAEGYVLTKAVMEWFWNHYADQSDRQDPRACPLRAQDLSGLPPTIIVTGEFDPLRDEGDAYAKALQDAGVPVHHIQARGHTHTSITMVDVVLSGAPIRAEMAEALKKLFPAQVPESVPA
jgi:acetyl esterase/lipase/cation diffusion facilitator CzcD-associated flavoprotein CzcO